jgi:hypothetical protein
VKAGHCIDELHRDSHCVPVSIGELRTTVILEKGGQNPQELPVLTLAAANDRLLSGTSGND